jgi:mono/diheme cytochrome c family protein
MAGAGAVLLTTANGLSQEAPQRPPADPQRQATAPAMPPGNVEHGRYIVEQVVHCAECHSRRDDRGEIVAAERFMGGQIPFRPPWPNDWALRAPRNRGLPGYTDQQAMRLLTQGAVDRDGNQLRPPMPRFRMTPQDAADVIAYMRSLEQPGGTSPVKR